MSVAIEYTGLNEFKKALAKASAFDLAQVLEELAATVESQTRARIQSEKAGPDGKAWPAWSEAYAAKRPPGKSLLQDSGILLASINYQIAGDIAEVGSNLTYAAIHQFGGTADMPPGPAGVPARPYFGVSADNEAELKDIIDDWASMYF